MIIFLDSQGALVGTSSSEPIGRNSNDVGMIYVVAPFSAATTIYFTFTLPNGDTLFGNLAEPAEGEVDTRQAATHLFGVSDTDLNVWRYKLKASVTRYAGTVHYTVVTVTESMTATAYGTFTVSRGNKITLPKNPPEDAWTTICTALGYQGTDIETIIERLCGDLKSETPAEGTIAARVAKNESDIEANRVALYGTDGNAEKPADGSLVQRMTAAEGAISTANTNASEAKTIASAANTGASDAKAIASAAQGTVNDLDALVNDKTNGLATKASKEYVDGIRLSLEMDANTYVLTAKLKRGEEVLCSTDPIDLPLETMVTGAEVSEDEKTLMLTLKNGQTVSCSIAKLLSGLVSEDTLTTKLSGKVDKPKDAWKVPVSKADANGNVIYDTMTYTGSPMKSAIPFWSSNLTLKTEKAVDNNDAVNLAQLVEELAKKVTADYTNDGYPRVYGKASNGDQKDYTIITSCYEESLPLRAKKSATSGMNDYGGCLTTSMPTQPYHCAPKKYVDGKIASLDTGVTNALGERVKTVTENIEYLPVGAYSLPENTLRFIKIENAVFEYQYGIYTNEEMTEMETGAVTETVTEVYNGEDWVMIPEDGYVQLAEGATTLELYIPDYNNMGPEGSFMMGCYHHFTLTYQVKVGT